MIDLVQPGSHSHAINACHLDDKIEGLYVEVLTGGQEGYLALRVDMDCAQFAPCDVICRISFRGFALPDKNRKQRMG